MAKSAKLEVNGSKDGLCPLTIFTALQEKTTFLGRTFVKFFLK